MDMKAGYKLCEFVGETALLKWINEAKVLGYVNSLHIKSLYSDGIPKLRVKPLLLWAQHTCVMIENGEFAYEIWGIQGVPIHNTQDAAEAEG
jgi:hypothetical protein